jgi:hypothetical protein
MTKINLIAICLLLFGQINAQTNIQSDEQKTNNTKTIKNLIYNYFLYDRENIHVQFNKNTYINNE